MHLVFSVEYKTVWGECVAVELTANSRVAKQAAQIFTLETSDGENWRGDVNVALRDADSFQYSYVICRGGRIVRREWDVVPRLFSMQAGKSFFFVDYWRDIPLLNHLYSTAYTGCVSHVEAREPRLVYFDKTIVFRVQAPQLMPGEALALIGSQPPLGSWMAERSIRMTRAGLCEWVVSVSAEGLYFPFEYKYVVVDERTGELKRWEDGDNRRSPGIGMEQGRVLVVFDRELHLRENNWRVAGVVVPVFSLRTETSQGVGDFGDLRAMADWAARTKMHIVQLLPVYDTVQTHTWRDCYPYNSISIYAFHPMYVDLSALPAIDDKEYMERYEQRRRELNTLPAVDYEAVNSLKEEYLRLLYRQEGADAEARDDYREFYRRNEEWLVPYAVFCMLRDRTGTCDFREWGEHSTYRMGDVRRLAADSHAEAGYYVYVQYLLDKQLAAATAYARSKGVVFKGDIPIGISRCSVEAWTEPYYFNMDGTAGAPPDAFSANGQNWGFPTYNWERMAEDGYSWWVRRFRKMAEYFDAYRIDHVLGFFRIWQVPSHSVHALLGHFSPSLPMSVEEIEGYGLHFRRQEWTEPYITDAIVADIFGAYADDVRDSYLVRRDDGRYSMRPEFSTQRQVEAFFSGKTGGGSVSVRDGLFRLISNVLFVADDKAPGLYHPRIAAMDDYVFNSLSDDEKQAFCRLHEDYYYHRHNDFWYAEAMSKLPTLVQSTRMLVCAEDLGMVPACVGPCLDRLKILSLEIEAMPKKGGLLFGMLKENPYRSVCTVFTHDMPTLRGWWEEDYGRSQRYYNQVLGRRGVAPQTMPGWLCEEVVSRHLESPSMLCLLSLQDWLGIDEGVRYSDPAGERINIPSNPAHYWRYRMHVGIEALIADDRLCDRIASLVSRGGRA